MDLFEAAGLETIVHQTFNYVGPRAVRLHAVLGCVLPLINANFCYDLRPHFCVNCLFALRGRCVASIPVTTHRQPAGLGTTAENMYDQSVLDWSDAGN